MADVAELSPFGEVACHSGKGAGENYKTSPRLSPLADYRPYRGLPNWNIAEVIKGTVQWGNPSQEDMALRIQQNRGGLWEEHDLNVGC